MREEGFSMQADYSWSQVEYKILGHHHIRAGDAVYGLCLSSESSLCAA
jgi:hypothetical protein